MANHKKRRRDDYQYDEYRQEDYGYDDYGRSAKSASRKKQDELRLKKKRKRKIILFIIEVIIILILLAGVYVWTQMNKINVVDKDQFDEDKVKAEIQTETEEVLRGYTNIAVFGLDNREEGIYDNGNSDVIMILSINNDTKEIKMLSVYRDTYLKITDERYAKANAAYANGGPEQAVWMLNNNLDLNITDYVSVDFFAVADVIDALGGVEIDIQGNEINYLNDYIQANNEILGTDSKTIWETGPQILDGTQAVAYTRIRYTSGMDFKRAQRQRLVLTRMIEKAKTDMTLKAVNQIVQKVFPQIETSMTQAELLSLIASAYEYDLSASRGFPFNKLTSNSSELGDCEVPCDLVTNVKKMHEFLFGNDGYVPSDTVESISARIVEKSGYTASSGYVDEFTEDDDFDGDSDSED